MVGASVTVLGRSPSSGPRTLGQLFVPQARAMLTGLIWLVLTNACALTVPRLVNIGIDLVEGRPTSWPLPVSPSLAAVAAGIIALAIVGAVVRTMSRVVLFNAGRDVEQDLRRHLFGHLGCQALPYFGKHTTGDLMSRLTNDLTNIRLLSGFALLNALNGVIIVGITLPILLAIDVKVTVIALVPFPLVIVLSQAVSRRLFLRTKENQESIGRLSSLVQEALAGQLVVRALSQEDAVVERFAARSDDVYASSMRLARMRIIMGPLMGLMGSLSIGLALWAGGEAVVSGRVGIGDVVEINTRIFQLTWPMIAIGFTLSVWQRGKASLVRINELLAARPEVVDGAHRRQAPRLLGRIAIEQVGVRRGEPPRRVLDGVSLVIEPGSFVGVVGRNGSGKSLLLKAIARQFDVEDGAVLIDDVDVKGWHLRGLRQAPGGLAVVPEDGFLFSATLRENLTFGVDHADDAEVEAIVDLVDLRRDVSRMPQGLATVVGERGVTLSGGQRQRVALGRALLAKPAILLLDDSLSAVDVETEQHIIESLRGLAAQALRPTIVMVSHRLSVLRAADQIVGLEAGRVVEQGRHEALMNAGGLYATLWGEEERARALEAKAAFRVGAGARS
jgi:ATP-binding cassette subfamily B multidrug efflux pump